MAETPSTSKPGYKTTEFWLTLLATLTGLLLASGIIGDGTVAAQIAGVVASTLTAMGYNAGRASIKRSL